MSVFDPLFVLIVSRSRASVYPLSLITITTILSYLLSLSLSLSLSPRYTIEKEFFESHATHRISTFAKKDDPDEHISLTACWGFS